MLTRIDAAAMDAETVQMVSIIDEEKDAHIIINAEGLIQFANKGVASVRLQLLTPLLPPPPPPCCTSFQHTDVLICNDCMPNSMHSGLALAMHTAFPHHCRYLGGARLMWRAKTFQC